jgi:predicted GH43/DUF377 family glycosyl hydrolase
MLYTDSSRGRSFAKGPAVVWYAGRYLMYYSIPAYGDGRPGDGLAIGIAESQDLEAWRRIGEIAPQADYEKNGLCAPGALVHDGRLHLFYQMYGNGPRDAICHAVSDDGLHFERNATNPIIRPSGAWNCGRAIDADVVVDGERLLLYWATRDPAMRVQMLGVSGAPLASAFGREDWVQLCEAPILAPELAWEQECIEAPAVCRHEGRFCMFYGGAYNCMPQQIGCAVSDDGVLWKRLSAEPFLPNGPAGAWNACESGHPYVFEDRDGRTHLFYQGSADKGQTWYLSRVELAWGPAGPRIMAGSVR